MEFVNVEFIVAELSLGMGGSVGLSARAWLCVRIRDQTLVVKGGLGGGVEEVVDGLYWGVRKSNSRLRSGGLRGARLEG